MSCLVVILYMLLTVTAQVSSHLSLTTKILHLRYPGCKWMEPGMTLDIRETTVVPEISGKDLDYSKTYLALFVDLDVIMPSTGTGTVALHWYQSDLSKKSTKHHHSSYLVPDKDHEDFPEIEAPYIAPRAPPNTQHRYVYFLFEQPPAYRFPHCFAHMFPPTPEARAGFDIPKFIQAAKLDPPLAMNYFVGWHEPKSGDPTSAMPSATTTSFRSVNCPTSSSSFVA